MSYRKKTLRRLPPVSRELARLIDDMTSLKRRAQILLVKVQDLEHDSRALAKAKQTNQPLITKEIQNLLTQGELFPEKGQ